jgi:hypothetical protein
LQLFLPAYCFYYDAKSDAVNPPSHNALVTYSARRSAADDHR